MATNLEKATELLTKEDFVAKVSACADQQATIVLFKENCVDVTAEDLANLGALLKSFNDNDDEIPDEVAEQVAGGSFDMSNLGKILGAVGDFLKALESPITTLISILSGGGTK